MFYCLFSFFPLIGFRLLVMSLIFFGYSLTNKQKAAIFDDFRLFRAFLGHSILSSPKWLNLHFLGNISLSKYFPFRTNLSLFCCVVHSEQMFNWTQFTKTCSAFFVWSNFSQSCFRLILLFYQTYVCLCLQFKTMTIICQYLFSFSRKMDANFWDHLTEAPFFGTECVNKLINGVVAAVRVVEKHSKLNVIVFFCAYNKFLPLRFHVFTFMRLWSRNGLENSQFFVFQTVKDFV